MHVFSKIYFQSVTLSRHWDRKVAFSSVILPRLYLTDEKRKMRHRDTSLYFPEFTFRASPSPDTGTSGREHETKKRRMVFKVTWWEEENEREDMKSLADRSWWSH